jgi:sterol 14alpha-demethylase
LSGLIRGRGAWGGTCRTLQNRIVAEQQEVLGSNKDADFDDLGKMDLLFNCIRESLRMHPPLIMLMRHCRADLVVSSADKKTYTVPKVCPMVVPLATGAQVADGAVAVGRGAWSRSPRPSSTGSPTSSSSRSSMTPTGEEPSSNESIVACGLHVLLCDPCPRRFAPGREEHKTNFAYVPFGGGIHACLGQQFGLLQLKTVLSVLFRKFELELVSPSGPASRLLQTRLA